MSGLPAQIPWRRFVRVLRELGYRAQKRKAGSGILFASPRRNPRLVSLREPYPGQNMRQRMLHEYLRKLLLTRGEPVVLTSSCPLNGSLEIAATGAGRITLSPLVAESAAPMCGLLFLGRDPLFSTYCRPRLRSVSSWQLPPVGR